MASSGSQIILWYQHKIDLIIIFKPLDLTALTVTDQAKKSYTINDGGYKIHITLLCVIKSSDIPCTPEIEPTYSYIWNFCADVTNSSYPKVCDQKKRGAAIQYIDRDDGFKECEVIGIMVLIY